MVHCFNCGRRTDAPETDWPDWQIIFTGGPGKRVKRYFCSLACILARALVIAGLELNAHVARVSAEAIARGRRDPDADQGPNGSADILTIPEAAKELDCSERHIERLIASGKLHSFKSGHLRRIRREALAAYIRTQEKAIDEERLRLLKPRPYRRRNAAS
jgi:excisionase family DNA binding protein